MEVGQNQVTLKRSKLGAGPGGYSLVAYTEETQEKIKADYANTMKSAREQSLNTGITTWEAPRDYRGGHYDHFNNFFSAIRQGGEVVQNPTFGLRAAGAALLANQSYYKKQPVDWDPTAMKLV